jgi:3-phenylpropionate/trans-cinnamate dioxygenase ferredoxin reductase component
MKNTYLIIGGGLAGASAVEGIREHDKEGTIIIICKEKYLPYHRPPLSKSLWTGKRTINDIFIKNEPFYRDNGVTVLLGDEIDCLDTKTKSMTSRTGKCWKFDKLLLATGGEPVKLKIPGAEDNGLLYFRNIDHYLALEPRCKKGSSALIIGGGFIGTELAAALSLRDIKVTMVFPESRPSFRVLPEFLGLHLLKTFRERGMEIVTRDKPAVIEKAKGKYRVRCESGKQLEAEIIIAGAGITPSVGLAESAGLAVQNGIVVNSLLQTSHPDIYSAGDNTSYPHPLSGIQTRVEHWDNALHQGKCAGKNMAGALEHYNYMPYFFSDIFEFGYEAVGEIDSRLITFADWQEENKKGVVYYLHKNIVKGVLLCNIWEKTESARELIKKGTPVVPESLRGVIR